MTKKDYEKAARIVKEARERASKNATHHATIIASGFLAFFSDDNPKFDAKRFLTACGENPDQFL